MDRTDVRTICQDCKWQKNKPSRCLEQLIAKKYGNGAFTFTKRKHNRCVFWTK